ncbi:MAG: DUF86 domain-containing protein [Nanoarchaeota archaeon]
MKDSSLFIDHVIENIEDIEIFIKNIDEDDFLTNKEKQNAVTRSLEIIGEAVKNIPEKIRIKYPKVPWKGVAGIRDKITHHYFGIDLKLIWKVVKEYILPLKKQMLQIKKEFNEAKEVA